MKENNTAQINTQKAILDLISPMDHELMIKYLDIMRERYSFMSFNYMGESILGRGIPMITLGQGKKRLVYVGAHSGDEYRISMALIRFINEYCEIKKNGGRIFNYSIDYLFATRSISVVPMLNPDGVEINLYGAKAGDILCDRILSMSDGKNVVGKWRANARGVSLGCNYASGYDEYQRFALEKGIVSGAPDGYCGDSPESEPEVGALCSNIRFDENIKCVVSLGNGDERISYGYGGALPTRCKSIVTAASRMSGYKIKESSESNKKANLALWCSEEKGIPAFEMCCSDPQKKLPDTYFDVYSRIREVLFTLPAMI